MRILDLYAGAGGLGLGFKRVFDAQHFAVEADRSAAATWLANFGDEIKIGRVSEFLDELPDADLVIGGPPCQGFSLLNIKSYRKGGDERNEEWRVFLEAVERSGARAFVIENVLELRDGGTWFKIKAAAEAAGFGVVGHVLCAADFGAPTIRKRFIIVGLAGGKQWQPPYPTHSGSEHDLFGRFEPWVTLRQAFKDLPEPSDTGEDPLHFDTSTPEDLARWAALPKDIPISHPVNWFRANRPDLIAAHRRNRSDFCDAYQSMQWGRPGNSITCHALISSSGHFGHPSRTRQLTLRECARVQSFPDSFKFTGSKQSIAKQIGNAVPPLLAEAIARSVKEQMP